MKNIILALGIFGVAISAQARSINAINKSGVLRVAVDAQSPPFNYYKGKDLVGFEVDLAKEIAKRMGLKVEWKVQPFNTLLVAIGQDRFDLIATSHAITPKRAEVVDFADPHYCTGAIIVSKPDGPKTGADLSGKVVVVPVGTVYYDKLKTMQGIKEVRTVPNETDGLQALLSGRADAWVTDQFVAFEAVKAHADSKIATGEVILSQRNAMVVAKGNSGLLAAVNEQLKALMESGTYMKFDKKYFDRDIRCK